MDGSDFSVYGEAKGEYTRQLCVTLVPTLETYFLDMFEGAKGEASHPSKVLWQFQTTLQAIPDWNQDKVLRETEKIQSDCKCDYLEELITAVFIAHTKVLSAIRLSTKQKKLQITIPKLDHFLHRVLSDCARQLWTNVFLFADTSSIEKQKNFRQVAELLRESVLQAIRGMLPVKNILREYLHEDDDEEEQQQSSMKETYEEKQEKQETQEDKEQTTVDTIEEQTQEKEQETGETQHTHETSETVEAPEAPETSETAETAETAETSETAEATLTSETKDDIDNAIEQILEQVSTSQEETAPTSEVINNTPLTPVQTHSIHPIIHIDAKPSVSFQQGHTFFSSDHLEANEIQDVPFAEAEFREDEEDEEDYEEIDSIQITDEILPMEAEEL